MADLRLNIDKPHIVIRAAIAKGNVGRKVPLWWDRGTLEDIVAWVAIRRAGKGGKDDNRVVCSLQPRRFGTALGRHILRKQFRTACRCLGSERLAGLTIHHGRHTFIATPWLAVGRWRKSWRQRALQRKHHFVLQCILPLTTAVRRWTVLQSTPCSGASLFHDEDDSASARCLL